MKPVNFQEKYLNPYAIYNSDTKTIYNEIREEIMNIEDDNESLKFQEKLYSFIRDANRYSRNTHQHGDIYNILWFQISNYASNKKWFNTMVILTFMYSFLGIITNNIFLGIIAATVYLPMIIWTYTRLKRNKYYGVYKRKE